MTMDLGPVLDKLDTAQTAYQEGGVRDAGVWVQPWSEELVKFLSAGVFLFSFIAIIAAGVLLWRSEAKPQEVLRTFGIVSIVGFSALLLVVGYDDEQLTPIVGLFGAIAGYLLGKSD